MHRLIEGFILTWPGSSSFIPEELRRLQTVKNIFCRAEERDGREGKKKETAVHIHAHAHTFREAVR